MHLTGTKSQEEKFLVALRLLKLACSQSKLEFHQNANVRTNFPRNTLPHGIVELYIEQGVRLNVFINLPYIVFLPSSRKQSKFKPEE